ncbi:GATA zinc finger domain-containing protein 16-like [Argonauta hians]
MTYTYLFSLGIVLPTTITVFLFILFLICWFKYDLREKFTKKKHDPHRVNQNPSRSTKPPTGLPPPPPDQYNRSRPNDQRDERFSARIIYSTYHDSGMSELHEIHYKFDRPVSQASTDSEDSGFRSSKSAHYLPNRLSENSFPQDIPLLKPVSANMPHAQRNLALNASDSPRSGPSFWAASSGFDQSSSSSSPNSNNNNNNNNNSNSNKIPTSISALSNIAAENPQPQSLTLHNAPQEDRRGSHLHHNPDHNTRSLPQSPLADISEHIPVTRPIPSSQSTPLPYPQWRMDGRLSPTITRNAKDKQTVIALVHSSCDQSEMNGQLSYAVV